MEEEVERSNRRVLRFFSNPAIGIAGSVASILGLVLAVYFFNASRHSRDLRYFVHPAKAVVVKIGQTSRLRVTVDGAPVERDITAAQVAFWNEGGEPIRPAHMLQPLVIRTGPNTQILEARIRKSRRDVSAIALDLSRVAEGQVRVSWTILERFDGGVLQLIYVGDADSPISATGIIEGQGDVRTLAFEGDPDQYQRRGGLPQRVIGYVYLGMGLLTGVFAVYRARTRKHMPASLKLMPFAVSAMTIAMSLYLIFWLTAKPGPPFGFE